MKTLKKTIFTIIAIVIFINLSSCSKEQIEESVAPLSKDELHLVPSDTSILNRVNSLESIHNMNLKSKGCEYIYKYSSTGALTSRSYLNSANGKVSMLTEYNSNGSLIKQIYYLYDSYNRLEFEKLYNSSIFYQYWYDDYGRLLWLDTRHTDGRLLSYLEFEYDDNNRIMYIYNINSGNSISQYWTCNYNEYGKIVLISTNAGGSRECIYSQAGTGVISSSILRGYGYESVTRYAYDMGNVTTSLTVNNVFKGRTVYAYGFTNDYDPTDPLNIYFIKNLP